MSQPAARLNTEDQATIQGRDDAPVVIVGNGPAGMQAARQLLARRPELPLVIYGDERHQPYNRVRLSSVLTGDVRWDGLVDELVIPDHARVEERLGYRVTTIDHHERYVIDQSGRRQAYSKLILATGSHPHVPRMPGIDLPGVFTFRDLDDANALIARRARSRHTVVLGGGLLGLEAARGMQRDGTRVTVIEHADRLMGNQLDKGASDALERRVRAMGIELIVGDGVRRVEGKDKVGGLRLVSGRKLSCDTLVVATGIRPNIGLARDARIAWGDGIRVDDNMCTSASGVYAVGECAEHRGHVYGLVAPGLEQAGVAVSHILGDEANYEGSLASTRLKVVGCDVFSMGPMGAHEERPGSRRYHFSDEAAGIYRTLLVHRHRLIGAVAVGAWDDTARVQSAVAEKSRVWPWQLWRFERTGSLWPEGSEQSVADWPATALVCQCKSVSRGELSEYMACGASSVEDLRACSGASSVCGSCKPLLEQLLGSDSPQPVAMHRWLLGSAVVSLLAALAFLLAPVIPYADSVHAGLPWDRLWRDGLLKQISGFTVLALFAVGLLLSPRKRIKRIKRFQSLGSFDVWRLVHIALGLLVIVALLAHTGLRIGSGLNAILMVSFVATLLLGAVSTGVISLEHRIGSALATRLRRQSVWWHILWFWPVPVVLGFHVLKSYWY